jgi:hypothetical protein
MHVAHGDTVQLNVGELFYGQSACASLFCSPSKGNSWIYDWSSTMAYCHTVTHVKGSCYLSSTISKTLAFRAFTFTRIFNIFKTISSGLPDYDTLPKPTTRSLIPLSHLPPKQTTMQAAQFSSPEPVAD